MATNATGSSTTGASVSQSSSQASSSGSMNSKSGGGGGGGSSGAGNSGGGKGPAGISVVPGGVIERDNSGNIVRDTRSIINQSAKAAAEASMTGKTASGQSQANQGTSSSAATSIASQNVVAAQNAPRASAGGQNVWVNDGKGGSKVQWVSNEVIMKETMGATGYVNPCTLR